MVYCAVSKYMGYTSAAREISKIHLWLHLEDFDMAAAIFAMTGEVVMVTGASSGLGAHFARVLAGAGASAVILAARRKSKLESVASLIESNFPQCKTVCVSMDVMDRASIKHAFQTAEDQLGGKPVSVLINNAGVAGPKLALDMEAEDWDNVIDTNLKGAFFTSQEAYRRMVETNTEGRVVNISSILGLRIGTAQTNYCAAKAGLLQVTKSMANELSRHKIRINALCPGYFETEMNADFFKTDAGLAYLKRIPPKRLGQIDELNGPLLLLSSKASSFMTGTEIVVDLGHSNSAL